MQRQTRSSSKLQLPQTERQPATNGVNHSEGKPVMKSSQNGVNGHVSGPQAEPQQGWIQRFLHNYLMPILLMVWSPNMVILFWYTVVKCEGSYQLMLYRLTENGIINGLVKVWSDIHIGSAVAVYVIFGYCLWALLLMIILPGPRSEGPLTPKGNLPVYKDNGFFCYAVTMAGFLALQYYLTQNGLSVTIVYDRFDEFLSTMTVISHVLCIFLTLKGLLAPSTSDSGSTGNLIMDYFWGTELYPRVFGIDIKVFTNCRFGMTVWPLLVMIFTFKSYELHGFVDSIWVSCALQMMYFTKFFWWEAGYMRTIDIMLDRAGFYICWGCLCYIPGVYASVSLYLVNHPVQLGPFWSLVIFAAGTLSLAINYIADKQKQDVRRTNGDCLIWGKKAEFIRAKYVLENGEKRESLLLTSGWWGVTRHFHYVPELTLTFFWSVPGLFENICVYSYFIWLVMLLTHRTFRDDEKCRKKYTHYWAEYCEKVPYKMIPGIF